LRALHEVILQDRRAAPAVERSVVVYLGDYIDRGPCAREVLDILIDRPLPDFEHIHLLGNHEAFLLAVLDGVRDADVWLLNGGDETLRSYGIRLSEIIGDPAVLRAALARNLPEAHERFLRGLGLSHVEGDYIFVHAGIRPGVALDAQNPDDLLWIREPFLSSSLDHGKVVVHGHTPGRTPDQRANRIGIDTGACYGGRLTALVLEGTQRRFLQV